MVEDKNIRGYRIIGTEGYLRFTDIPGDVATPVHCELGTVNNSNSWELNIPSLNAKFTLSRAVLKGLLGDEIAKEKIND